MINAYAKTLGLNLPDEKVLEIAKNEIVRALWRQGRIDLSSICDFPPDKEPSDEFLRKVKLNITATLDCC